MVFPHTEAYISSYLCRWGTRDEEPLVNGGVDSCRLQVLVSGNADSARLSAVGRVVDGDIGTRYIS